MEAPLGTRPFVLKEYRRGTQTVWERNPSYWDRGLPYLDQVIAEIAPQYETRQALLMAGRVEANTFFSAVTDEDYRRMQQERPDYHFVGDLKSHVLNTIYFNTTQPPFNDIRVRQAVSLAINRQAWVDSLHYGEGCLYHGPIPCGQEAWQLPLDRYPEPLRKFLVGYDPDEAKRLLAAAGFPNGLATTLTYAATVYGATWDSRYELAASDLAKVGINATLQPQEYGRYIASTYLGQFEGAAIGPVTPYAEPDYFLYGHFFPGQAANRSSVDDPALNDLLVQQRTAMDPAERLRIVHQIQLYLADRAYYVYLPTGYTNNAVPPYVQGFVPAKVQGSYGVGKMWMHAWLER